MLALPLRLYKAQYEVGDEREFFELDSMLLRAIGEDGLRTVASLEAAFRIHRRLLIGSLLDLFEDGWLAILHRGSGVFTLTRRGQQWLASGRPSLPPRSEPRKDSFYFYQEQLTGGLIPRTEIAAVAEDRMYKEKHVHFLPEEIAGTWIDSGAVWKLRRDSLGRANLLSMGDPVQVGGLFYLGVDPVLQEARVLRLPRVWKSRLERRLLQEASFLDHRFHGNEYTSKKAQRGKAVEGYLSNVRNDDLQLGVAAHRQLLSSLLARAAKGHSILVCSPDASADYLADKIISEMKQALLRGASVTVLWNCVEKSESSKVAAKLQEVQHAVANQAGSGGFQFNQTAIPHRASLLIFGHRTKSTLEETGDFLAAISSFSWLGRYEVDPEKSNPGAGDIQEAGIIVHHPHLVGHLAGLVATFLGVMSSKPLLSVASLASAQFYWRDVSRILGRQRVTDWIPALDAYKTDLWVIREYEYLPLIIEEVMTCAGPPVIVSSSADKAGTTALRDALAQGHVPTPTIIAGRIEDDAAHDFLQTKPSMHACVVVGKGAFIGNIPPLCGVPSDMVTQFGISIRITGDHVADILRRAFILPGNAPV